MKIVVFLFACLSLASSASAGPRWEFLPPATCREEPDVSQCEVARPKDWTHEERRVVEASMQRLTSHPVVRGILVAARANGYRGFRRYSTHTEPHPTQGRVPTFSPGFVLFRSRVIGITDAFFQTAGISDPISGYRFEDLILLHELVHAFDDRKASIDERFTSIVGWVFKNNRWEYTRPVPFSTYKGVVAETLTLYGRGQHADAWARDRAFATSMPFPLPTIQALVNPGESFADILAHLVLDRQAVAYLDPAVVTWFEQHVFPALSTLASDGR